MTENALYAKCMEMAGEVKANKRPGIPLFPLRNSERVSTRSRGREYHKIEQPEQHAHAKQTHKASDFAA